MSPGRSLVFLPLLIAVGVGIPILPLWADDGELAGRLERLERRLSTEVILSLHRRIADLEAENSELRDRVERLGHDLQGVAERQRTLYLDIDQRLQALTADTSATVVEIKPSAQDRPRTATAIDPEQAYRTAVEMLQAGHYASAIAKLTAFLADFPNHRYAGNALYWLGEAYYVQRDYPKAFAAFTAVQDRYPTSYKVPDARLKAGFTLAEQGRWEEARDALEQVRLAYPNSTIAQLATERIKTMRQQGH